MVAWGEASSALEAIGRALTPASRSGWPGSSALASRRQSSTWAVHVGLVSPRDGVRGPGELALVALAQRVRLQGMLPLLRLGPFGCRAGLALQGRPERADPAPAGGAQADPPPEPAHVQRGPGGLALDRGPQPRLPPLLAGEDPAPLARLLRLDGLERGCEAQLQLLPAGFLVSPPQALRRLVDVVGLAVRLPGPLEPQDAGGLQGALPALRAGIRQQAASARAGSDRSGTPLPILAPAPPLSPLRGRLPRIRFRGSVGCMATSINRADLLGNLGGDPEFRHLPDGTVVARLRLATSRSWKDRGTGEWKEATEWHDVAVWQAGRLEGRLSKGDRIHVSGRLRTREWDKDGARMQRTEIVCRAGSVILLASKPGSGAPDPAAAGAVSGPPPDGGDDDGLPY